ncbi:MAG: ADOP family duplicated permease [Vicinamibacteria bacterium]
MSALSTGRRAWARVRALFGRSRLERDLDEELRFHLEMRAAALGASGLDPRSAGEAASRQFGSALSVKERCREAWTFASLETLAQDARLAARTLLRSPGFTAAAVASLALGIGANAAMFSLVSAVLLRPLPYPDANRLVRLTGSYPKGAVVALQERSRTMDVAGVSADQTMNLTADGRTIRVSGSVASANLFALLGRPAARGRALAGGDEAPGRDRVVVLGHGLWQSAFGGDEAVVGRTIAVDGVPRQVVGVMPEAFAFPSGATQIWLPLRLDPTDPDDYWGFGWMPALGRLRPGATPEAAHEELRALMPQVAALFPFRADSWNADAVVRALQADLVEAVRPKLLVLQAAVAIVLLIACANVASLLLARAAARRRELALRAALGASRPRIVRQLLTESVALALAGGLAGTGLAHLLVAGLRALPGADAGSAAVGVDGRVLAFATALSVACGLLFGVVPALVASRVDIAGAVKSGSARTAGPGTVRIRGVFIATEVALAVVLSVGAGLLVRTLAKLARVEPGFAARQALAATVSPNPSVCAESAGCVALYDDLMRRAAALPGVRGVAAASGSPLAPEQPLLPVEIEGQPPLAPGAPATLLWAGGVTPSYFDVMGIPLLRGRAFAETDAAGAAAVVVVSASTARRFWPGEDPIGRTIRVMWDAHRRTVVGVVGDVRQYALSGRSPDGIVGAFYMPYPQAVGLDRRIPRSMTLFVRPDGAPAGAAESLRQALAVRESEVSVGEVQSLSSVVSSSVSEPRALTWLFAAFAACALLLAAIGTYGLVAYSAAQRTYEIGVRVAIGASRRQVFALVMGESVRLVAVGLVAGLVAALALARGLSRFLYEVSASDPATFAGVSLLLVVTALLAGFLPGRRAAAIDPVRALRTD